MTFRRFGYQELVAAFEALDRVATGPRRVLVFGGTAIALYTQLSSGTSDVDHQPPSLEDLVARCRAQGLDLPSFNMPTISEFPYNHEDRLQHMLVQLKHLEVLVPEPHDLALSKVLRWYEGDESDIGELHRAHPLAKATLIERYRDEMTHVMGERRRIDANFIECISMLFGEIAAEEARELI